MTILPQLERDLVEAARKRLPTADPAVTPKPRRRSIRPGLGSVAAAFSVAVTLAIAGLAIVLLGNHRNSSNQPSATRTPPAVSGAQPVPTLQQLRAHFAVLRRPQTAADRSWGEGDISPYWRPLRGLTRLLSVLIGGNRVFLTVDQFRGPPPRGRVAAVPRVGSLSISVSLVDKHGNSSGVSYDADTSYAIFPVPLGSRPLIPNRHRRPLTGPSGVPAWTSLVPDGVARVRWVFACRAVRSFRCNGFPGTPIVDFPVHNNAVAARIADTDSCAPVACRATTVIWYDASGRPVATYDNAREPNRQLVPFPGIKP